MKQLLLLNPEHVSEQEAAKYKRRDAARAVVADPDGKYALLYVGAEKYYKLPGGGIKNTENVEEALRRECKEEIGTDIEITGEVGTIVEYRKIFALRQTSYCYHARMKGTKRESSFTDDERAHGFEVRWFPFDEALHALETCTPMGPEGKWYIVPRDIAFLKATKKSSIK